MALHGERAAETSVVARAAERGIASRAWVGTLAMATLVATVSMLRYRLYLSDGWDLGYYVQALDSLWHHGLWASSSWAGYLVMSRSLAWVLWPLGLVDQLVLGNTALLIVQAVAIGGGVWYLEGLGQTWGLSIRARGYLLALYMLNPLLWSDAVFDFHPANLAIPLVLAVMYYAERRRPFWAGGAAALAMACQDMAVLAVAVVAVVLLLRGRRREGLAVALMVVGGAAVDAAAVSWMAAARHSPWVEWGVLFGHWGATPARALGTVVAHPGVLVRWATRMRDWLYVGYVGLPFVPLLVEGRRRLWWWLIPLPLVLINLWADNPVVTSPYSQYSALVVPLVSIAAAGVLSRSPARRLTVAGGVLASVLVLGVSFVHLVGINLKYYPAPGTVSALAAAEQRIPVNGAVVTQNFVAAHVADREFLTLIKPGMTFRRGQYVLLTTGGSSGATAAGVVSGDIGRLHQAAHLLFAENSVYLFRIGQPVVGVK